MVTSKDMNLGDIVLALIILFVLTVVFYVGDPLFTGFIPKFYTAMGVTDMTIYDNTIRGWRLTVPAFIVIMILLLYKSTKDSYGGQFR